MDIAPFDIYAAKTKCEASVGTEPLVILESSIQTLFKEDRPTQTVDFSQRRPEVDVDEEEIESFLARCLLF